MGFLNRPRVRSTIEYALPLILFFAVVLVVFAVFHIFGPPLPDGAILTLGAVMYGFATATILVFTRNWELRTLGQLAKNMADMLLYGVVGLSALGLFSHGHNTILDFIRALIVVAVPTLIVGVIMWWRRKRQRRTRSNVHEGDRPANW